MCILAIFGNYERARCSAVEVRRIYLLNLRYVNAIYVLGRYSYVQHGVGKLYPTNRTLYNIIEISIVYTYNTSQEDLGI